MKTSFFRFCVAVVAFGDYTVLSRIDEDNDKYSSILDHGSAAYVEQKGNEKVVYSVREWDPHFSAAVQASGMPSKGTKCLAKWNYVIQKPDDSDDTDKVKYHGPRVVKGPEVVDMVLIPPDLSMFFGLVPDGNYSSELINIISADDLVPAINETPECDYVEALKLRVINLIEEKMGPNIKWCYVGAKDVDGNYIDYDLELSGTFGRTALAAWGLVEKVEGNSGGATFDIMTA